MSRGHVSVPCAAVAVALLGAVTHAGFVSTSPNLPPLGGAYLGQFHSWGGGAFTLSNPTHDQFTSNQPPPPPGGSQTHSFSSSVHGTFSVSGGPSNIPVSVPGVPCSVRVTSVMDSGPTRFFDTEMLQLNIVGGGVMIRESPTLPSVGQTVINDLGGGMYHIDSFFDVFTELSIDGGQSWIPSDGSVRMTLEPAPGGVVLFALAGAGALRRRR